MDLLSSLAPDVGVLAREHRHCRCMGEKWGRVGWDGGHCAGYRWDGGAGSGAGFWRQRAFQAGLASPRTGPTPSRSPSDPCLFGAHRARIRRIGHQRIGRDFTTAVSYEAIRRWCAKFGQAYANQLRRRRPALRRQVAPRRGVRRDQRQAAVPVARGRPARQRARRSGPVTPKRGGGQAILPYAAQGRAVRAARAGHRQAGQLPGRPPRAHVGVARLPDPKVCWAQSANDVQAISGLALCRAGMSTR